MIEDIVFAKKKVCFDKLVDKGFVKMDEGDFIYSERFMDDMFEAQVIVDRSGHVSGQVVDLELGEDYLPLRVASENTAFVGQVRQAYQGILQKIAGTCFVDELFMSAQANRVADYLSATYGDVFDRPFEKYPDYISFRVGGKWYALILPLAFGKLDKEGAINWSRLSISRFLLIRCRTCSIKMVFILLIICLRKVGFPLFWMIV